MVSGIALIRMRVNALLESRVKEQDGQKGVRNGAAGTVDAMSGLLLSWIDGLHGNWRSGVWFDLNLSLVNYGQEHIIESGCHPLSTSCAVLLHRVKPSVQ
jgi:hypothetical protein